MWCFLSVLFAFLAPGISWLLKGRLLLSPGFTAFQGITHLVGWRLGRSDCRARAITAVAVHIRYVYNKINTGVHNSFLCGREYTSKFFSTKEKAMYCGRGCGRGYSKRDTRGNNSQYRQWVSKRTRYTNEELYGRCFFSEWDTYNRKVCIRVIGWNN